MSISINRDSLTHGLDLPNLTGIEIGPLVNPIVTHDMSNVKYVDRASTAELREWYCQDKDINVDDIMEIDYVWGDQSLSEATDGKEQFDYCIASHVIEHIPDLITWLEEISSILKVGGTASFAVPDKRYTFDILRSVTTPAEVIDCYLRKLRRPSFRHIYDHFSNHVDVEINDVWDANFDASQLRPGWSAEQAFAACRDALDNDKYVDSHCSVFTEDSFFELLTTVSALGLLGFRVKRNFPVSRGRFEFFVQLEKIDSKLPPVEKHALFLKSLEQMQSCALSLDFCANVACFPKLYYSTTGMFSETESVELAYETAGSQQNIKFKLPMMDDVSLRFDPCECEAIFEIGDIIYNHAGKDHPVALSSVSAFQDIDDVQKQNSRLLVHTQVGKNDPALLIRV
ncbi:MAG: class I SAM-dependent methyltransferase [Arenicella sp.]|nr:class I SAM-dependent methyltransferase [Arenicella sp.]